MYHPNAILNASQINCEAFPAEELSLLRRYIDALVTNLVELQQNMN